MMRLKIALRKGTKCRPKFAYVSGRELHCFRHYRPVRFVLHPLVGMKRRQRISGYAVSELSTLNRICGGRTVSAAIINSRDRLARRTSRSRLVKVVREVRREVRTPEMRRRFACA